MIKKLSKNHSIVSKLGQNDKTSYATEFPADCSRWNFARVIWKCSEANHHKWSVRVLCNLDNLMRLNHVMRSIKRRARCQVASFLKGTKIEKTKNMSRELINAIGKSK